VWPGIARCTTASMFSSTGAVHGGPPQARYLAALEHKGEGHRFVTATSNPQHDSNEIQVVHFDEETSSVRPVATYSHPGAATAMCPSTVETGYILTASRTGVTLWNLEDFSNEDQGTQTASASHGALNQLAEAPTDAVASLAVRGTSVDAKVAAGRTSRVSLFNMDSLEATDTLEVSQDPQPHMDGQIRRCTWDPHNSAVLCSACDTAALLWDSRASVRPSQLFSAHKYGATDVDFNPNRPMVLVTAGEDRLVKFWDLRHTQTPIRVLAGHSHWVSTARYNRFHDQLVLSTGTDGAVNLWRVSSISSSPILDYDGEPGTKTETMDSKINTYDDHEEAVYSAAWSASDAWVFASLSLDGRLVVSLVPSTEKYKILL